MKQNNFIFFGTSRFSCIVLDELLAAGFLPSLIVTTPDRPQGRKLALTAPEAKVWAEKHGVPVFQPEKLRDTSTDKNLRSENDAEKKLREQVEKQGVEFFVVASYGKIIPQAILDIPGRGTLNVHPSLLPKFRGATPIQSAILSEENVSENSSKKTAITGVTIILVDDKVDHGPIVAQEEVMIENWPPYADMLEEKLARSGGKLLAKVIPDWIKGKIKPVPQDHSQETFTKKITKEDGLIDLAGEPEKNLRKIRAYRDWPTAYFFTEYNGKQIRVVIREADVADGKLEIKKVIPEGKKEMSYQDFLRGVR